MQKAFPEKPIANQQIILHYLQGRYICVQNPFQIPPVIKQDSYNDHYMHIKIYMMTRDVLKAMRPIDICKEH